MTCVGGCAVRCDGYVGADDMIDTQREVNKTKGRFLPPSKRKVPRIIQLSGFRKKVGTFLLALALGCMGGVKL